MTWEPIAVVASLWLAVGMTCASALLPPGPRRLALDVHLWARRGPWRSLSRYSTELPVDLFGARVAGLLVPFTAVQMLWVNIIMDLYRSLRERAARTPLAGQSESISDPDGSTAGREPATVAPEEPTPIGRPVNKTAPRGSIPAANRSHALAPR